ncbi:MAG TPA: bifunctional phosphopantothenoylcysteine decarboxylase/phosphopantothenate--cysteine ligase CoaBC [Thermoanaerobaculia bacterium]|jgi:phosphopantothenoylcysteine decarboxylase/phosphopantothenate--cysteine ligase|nr:bifunctional phosphopantothenoylcysteine decarboxylase/phosphopantothenate--cysteine ligase CoaBC [Thermoanaerobaculia bacterium]
MSRSLRVLLGVSGGIAAYKSAELVRRLRSRGHEVRCALTRSAVSFVTPLTLEVLSGRRVYQEEYLAATGSGEEAHITAAAWAEVLCVAPATTHILARLALGLGDDFLTTTALAFAGPVVVAPAMHSVMWEAEPTRQHVETLKRRGVWFAGPVEGALASGEVGMGRMAESEEIARAVEAAAGAGPLAGRTVLVTAGPTHEPVDPVRFLGNRSSGKMGFALAAEAARRGARTILVAGPVALPTPPGVNRVDVVTAREMQEAVREHAPSAGLIVMAAAVADFRPSRPADRKIKKEQGLPAIELEENPDILAGLRAVAPGAVLVGFAAETHDLERNARAKLERKGADFLVANDVSRSDIAFGSGDNEVTVYRREGEPVFLARRPKGELAASLFDLFAATLSSSEHLSAASPL